MFRVCVIAPSQREGASLDDVCMYVCIIGLSMRMGPEGIDRASSTHAVWSVNQSIAWV